MNNKLVSLSILILISLITSTYASNIGTASGLFLKVPVGSKAIAVGGAYTSVADDVYSNYWNPAGLRYCESKQVLFMHNPYIQDINYEYLAVSFPVNSLKGTMGVNLGMLDAGDFKGTQIAQDGITPISKGDFNSQSLFLGISYGRELYKNISFGGTLKYIKSSIASYNATAFAADLGLQIKSDAGIPVKLGAVIQNVGSGLKYNTKSEKLPLTSKFGVSTNLDISNRFSIAPSFDISFSNSSDFGFNFGAEMFCLGNYSLRLGYDSLNNAGSGLTMGTGVKYGNFGADFAYVPFSDIGNSFNFSIAYDFGKVQKQDYKLKVYEKEVNIEKSEQKLEIARTPLKEPEPVVEPEQKPQPKPQPAVVPPPAQTPKIADCMNSILRRDSLMSLNSGKLIFSPIFNSSSRGNDIYMKNMLESKLRVRLTAELGNNIVPYSELKYILSILDTNDIITSEDAMKVGLLSDAELILFGDLTATSTGRYIYYYKVFKMAEKKVVLEGRVDFHHSQLDKAVNAVVSELKK